MNIDLGSNKKVNSILKNRKINVKSKIDEANNLYELYYNTGNAQGVTSLHTEDAVVMPPNSSFRIGKKEIEKGIAAEIDMGAGNLKFIQTDLIVNYDIAYETGTYSMEIIPENQDKVKDFGKYVVIWEKQDDGKWLIKKDIWNTSIPLAN
jgi:uncharacterized protein (TIGR02246 family)